MSEPTFAVGDRVWVSAAGTDGGDAGYATLIAIRDNGTCDLRDDNDAEYWSLLSHLTPTQPPAPTEATARIDLSDMTDEYLVRYLSDLENAAGMWHGMGLSEFEQGLHARSLTNYEKGRDLRGEAGPIRAEIMRRLKAARQPEGVRE